MIYKGALAATLLAVTPVISTAEDQVLAVSNCMNLRGTDAERIEHCSAALNGITGLNLAINLHLVRGVSHYKLGNYGRAIEDFTRSLDLNSRNEPSEKISFQNLMFRGRAYLGSGGFVNAYEDFIAILKFNPQQQFAIMGREMSKCRARSGALGAINWDHAVSESSDFVWLASEILRQSGHFQGEPTDTISSELRASLDAWQADGCPGDPVVLR